MKTTFQLKLLTAIGLLGLILILPFISSVLALATLEDMSIPLSAHEAIRADIKGVDHE